MPADIQIISSDEIRSEKMSFKDMVVRCLDRIHVLASQTTEKNTRASMAAYEESIASLHCFLSVYYGTQYNENARQIEAELNENRQMKDIKRLMILRQWLALITRNLSRVGMVPPIDVVYDMATPEQKVEEETLEFLRIMRKFIRLNKQTEMIEWFKKGGKLEKKTVVIERPKIEDIIDASYLRKKV